jgi:transcriptional regulator with XRE-family HTH domain
VPVVGMAQLDASALQRYQLIAGLRNDDVADRIGIARSTWSLWKKSGRVPISHLDQLARVLDFDVPEIVPDDLPEVTHNTLVTMSDELAKLRREVTRLVDVLESKGALGPDAFNERKSA